MKLKDITIGGRYRARVAGKVATVRVLGMRETSTFGGRCRTTIVAENESTGRQVAIRSAQRLRALPLQAWIGAIESFEDLAPGQRAVPEPGVQYDLRPARGKPLGVTVHFVIRTGDMLLAQVDNGARYPVTGTGAYILCPRKR